MYTNELHEALLAKTAHCFGNPGSLNLTYIDSVERLMDVLMKKLYLVTLRNTFLGFIPLTA